MICPARILHFSLALAFSAALCGCSPSGPSANEDEKEPHFLAGKSRVNAFDFKGAIESFEKALEVNPRSASAHLELGWLLAEKEPDPAAAIYHYQQYLKLKPKAENADIIAQHIQVLKQDLARNVLPPTITPAMQREFEQLGEENRRLKEEVDKWRAYYASRGAQTTTSSARVERPSQDPTGMQSASPSGAAPATRTHKVQSGETPSSIARKYGIKLETLMAANPGLNPTRLRIGQTLNIPSP
jgi:LysM repeat protein